MEENNESKPKNKISFSALETLVTATQTLTTGTKYTKDDIETYISNPSRYHQTLRQISDYFMFYGIYNNIITSTANLPTLDYIVSPSLKTLERKDDKSYSVYLDKINNYTYSINVKQTVRNIIKNVAKYGAYIGYERNNGSDFYIQTLPLDYCRIKYKVGHDYQLEFNFKYFDKFWNKEDIDLAWLVYPPEFKKLWNRYKADKKSRNPEWQMIDINKTYCILADDDSPFFVPMYSTMFKAILNNEEYETIVKTGQVLEITKLIAQKLPSDKDGNLLVDEETARIFHEALVKALPTGANGITTPFDIHDVAFSNQTQTKEQLLEKAERGAFVSSGWSSALFAENSGVSSLNMNIEVVTANIYALLEKIESAFSRKFRGVVNTKNYEFNLKFFRTTNLNIEDNFNRMYKLLEIGGAITPLISLSNFDFASYISLLDMETQLKIKDMLVPVQSIHTQSGGADSSKSGGRPEVKNPDNDSTAISKDRGSNDPMNRA
jgi:hypothetical protein